LYKYLVINADDFGLAPGVNRAIIELYRRGIVSSTSIMANMPGFQSAVRMARTVPGLGVGLHFNITDGFPVSPSPRVRSLVDENGRFSGQLGAWREEDIATELQAQWTRCTELGLLLTHLDAHQDPQVHPIVYRPMVQWALSKRVCMRRMERPPVAELQHPVSADRLISDSYYEGDGKERLLKHLHSLQPGITEINCHPGYVDQILTTVSAWTRVRELELQVFSDPEAESTLRNLDIRLVHFGRLRKLLRAPMPAGTSGSTQVRFGTTHTLRLRGPGMN